MDLNQLTRFTLDKRKEFEKAVRDEAKNLLLEDITREIHLKPWEFMHRNFQDGQPLKFILCQGNYSILISKNELILRGSYDIEVARFTGDKVNRYYTSLSSEILKAESEEVIPF